MAVSWEADSYRLSLGGGLEYLSYRFRRETGHQWKIPVESFYLFICFCLFKTTPEAYGGSQARGRIGAIAASHSHSHSHTGSEPCLRPIPQLMATPDPQPSSRHGTVVNKSD